MTDLENVLTDQVKSLQESAKSSLDDRLRWFATLELESVVVEDEMAVFVWHDPKTGQRHGYRWEIVPDRLYLLTAHLDDDVALTEHTEPDEDGVHWWGVYLYA